MANNRHENTCKWAKIRWVKYSMIAVLIFVVSAPGCSKQSKSRVIMAPTEVAKVRISADGKVYLNERVVTLDELQGELQRLKRVQGGVWLVDESSDGPARKQGQKVSAAIVAAELPMRMK